MRPRPFLLAAVAIALTVGLVLLLDRQYPGTLSGRDSQIDLVWKLVVLAALAASLVTIVSRQSVGATLRAVLAWLGLGLALVVGYTLWEDIAPVVQRVGGQFLPAEPRSVAPGVVALRTDASGHFRAVAEVTGPGGARQRVQFLVDTGASDVALTRADASRLGIDIERLSFTIPYRTANGTAFGARVRLPRVALGEVAVEDVAGSVVSGELDRSLLGMSFLRRLSGFEIRGNEMILRQ